jgi:hypothetical protein
MVWANGQLVSEKYLPQQQGHQWTLGPNGRIAIRVDRSLADIEPGPVVPITVSLWEKDDNNGRYLETSVAVPGTPSSFVLPTVPSGQAIGPRVIREMFTLRPSDVDGDGILPLIQGRLSHLSVGIHCSPGDSPSWDTFDKWRDAWNTICKPGIDWCVANGFRIVGIGDDWWRNENERLWTHISPFREQAIRHVAAYLRDSGVCDVVRMVDEVVGDPSFYQPEEFLAWWRDEGGPPISWAHQYPIAWEVPAYSEQSWRYWTEMEWRGGRKRLASTIWQMWNGIKRAYLDVPASRPWHCQVAATGPYYQKKVTGSEYQEGDELIKGGCRAADIIAQTWLALGQGASGLGFYAYDYEGWRSKRANQVPGTIDPDGIQTGTRPGDERWKAIEDLESVTVHEAELVSGTPYEPVESGPWVFCRRGSVVWGINTGGAALPSPNGPGEVVGQGAGSLVPGPGVILWTV